MAFAVMREITIVEFLRINCRDKILRIIISTKHAVLMNIIE